MTRHEIHLGTLLAAIEGHVNVLEVLTDTTAVAEEVSRLRGVVERYKAELADATRKAVA